MGAGFEVRWVYEDEVGRLCPLCGSELRKIMEGRICHKCNILYKIRRRPVAGVEEEAWALRIPEEMLRDPGVKVVILKVCTQLQVQVLFPTSCRNDRYRVVEDL
ncbi:MAG: hypothetical protein B9J98_07150 [Candidatus Terraquivivens tikiterensis]|uniref:Uncharacterized protein n=1 Tax=Candidatus Terraquivivens tikiterensis TaxID=1980982 RepID=A0A2R7Y120_9ARCH|nr:MAG: hypothetical protein B9J98_07150 [Candidatus Terraquivivens tikiterensis]